MKRHRDPLPWGVFDRSGRLLSRAKSQAACSGGHGLIVRRVKPGETYRSTADAANRKSRRAAKRQLDLADLDLLIRLNDMRNGL